MQRCFDAMDLLQEAVHVADLGGGIPGSLGQAGIDIEMSCVSMYHLGHLYAALQLEKQAKKQFYEAIPHNARPRPHNAGPRPHNAKTSPTQETVLRK